MYLFGVCLLMSQAISFTSSSESDVDLINRRLHCHFHDSVNVSDGVELPNGNIVFDGIEYSEDQYSEIDYILVNGFNRIDVDPHIRGCTCNLKPCLRLCCPHGSFVERMEFGEEIKCLENETAQNLVFEVLHEDEQISTLNLDHHFGYVNRICDFHYYAKDFLITHVRKKNRWFFLWKQNSVRQI